MGIGRLWGIPKYMTLGSIRSQQGCSGYSNRSMMANIKFTLVLLVLVCALTQAKPAKKSSKTVAKEDKSGWYGKKDLKEDKSGWYGKKDAKEEKSGWYGKKDAAEDKSGWYGKKDAAEDKSGWYGKKDVSAEAMSAVL